MQNITRRNAISLGAASAASVALPAAVQAAAVQDQDAWMAGESIQDLALYYDACWAADAGLIAHYNQPRCDRDGVVGVKIDTMADEFMRRVQAVAEHVATRAPDNRDEAHHRHTILMHWQSKIDDGTSAVALAREIIALHGGEA